MHLIPVGENLANELQQQVYNNFLARLLLERREARGGDMGRNPLRFGK